MAQQHMKNRAVHFFVKGLLSAQVFFGGGASIFLSQTSLALDTNGQVYAQSNKGRGGGASPSATVKTPVPAASSPALSPAVSGGDSPLPPTHRTVIHTEAYKKREGFGPHVNFKITPPEKRGRKGRVLVEVYNYSKVNLAVVNFWLILSNQWGDRIEVQINCDEIPAGWSALKWVKVPGDKAIPEITSVQIKNMKIFDDQGRESKIKYFTDLIKQ